MGAPPEVPVVVPEVPVTVPEVPVPVTEVPFTVPVLFDERDISLEVGILVMLLVIVGEGIVGVTCIADGACFE